MKKLNLNSFVKFRLNEYGKDIFYCRYDEINKWLKARGCEPQFESSFPEVDQDGFTELQLWEFMQIYGPYVGNGVPAFWEELNFYIKDEDLDEVEE